MINRTAMPVAALATMLFAGCAAGQTNAPDGAAPTQANPAPVSPARPGPQTPAPDAARQIPADASVDQVLDALDARGRDLRSFEADVTLAETLAAAGATTTRSGKAYYQLRPGGEAR